jgi:hypothetical protein
MKHPIGLGDLLAYWLGELPSPEAGALEEHVFACEACSDRLSHVHDAGAALVELVRRGMLNAHATTALLNRFSRDRLNVRQYTLHPGQVVACTVSIDDDFLLAHLMLDRPAPARVDMAVIDGRGRELVLPDVVIDPRGNQVLPFLPARPVQDQASGKLQYVLYAVDDGQREEIGRYTLDHTAMRDA